MILSMLLVYLGIALFLYLTLKNKKPIKWNQIFDAISFNSNINDDIFNIPGPLRLPFIGTTWMKYFRKANKLHEYYEELNEKYGDIVLETLGNINIVSIYKRLDIEKVLKNPTKFPFRPPIEIQCVYRSSNPERYASVGLTNSNGEKWSFLRSKMTSKTFENRKMLSQFFPTQNEICDDFISKIKACRNENNAVESVNDILRLFAFESSSSFIMGKRMGAFGNTNLSTQTNALKLAEATRNLFIYFRDSHYGNQMWKYFPSKLYQDYVKAEETCFETVQDILKDLINEGLTDDGSPLMTILMADGLDEKEKIVGVVDFLISGIDTLQTAVLILFYYISQRPDCQLRVREETSHFDGNMSFEDIYEAHYTRAVIQEAFRLCASAFALARIAETDLDISGYHLKSGTIILCHTFVACQKEENFVDAKTFKPERWINEQGKFDSSLCKGASMSIPFGAGRRICPGRKYSEFLLMFLIAKLSHAFEIKFLGEMERTFEFMLKIKTPVGVEFRDRL